MFTFLFWLFLSLANTIKLIEQSRFLSGFEFLSHHIPDKDQYSLRPMLQLHLKIPMLRLGFALLIILKSIRPKKHLRFQSYLLILPQILDADRSSHSYTAGIPYCLWS